MPTYRSPDEPPPDAEPDLHGPVQALAYVSIAVVLLVGCAVAAPADALRLLAILAAVFVPTLALGRWIGLWGLLLPLPFLVWWIVHAASVESGDLHGGLAMIFYGAPLTIAIAGVLCGAFLRTLARLKDG